MKEHPILFKGEMARAILDGRKTQTRRILKAPRDENAGTVYENFGEPGWAIGTNFGRSSYGVEFPCPYGVPGDRLWVRETWGIDEMWSGCVSDTDEVGYPITGRLGSEPPSKPYCLRYAAEYDEGKWRPSIHMPRWASRITLEITGVRVGRVNAITEQDAWDEGFPNPRGTNRNYADRARYWFKNLWDSINAKRGKGWDANPWVWVIEFKVV